MDEEESLRKDLENIKEELDNIAAEIIQNAEKYYDLKCKYFGKLWRLWKKDKNVIEEVL